MRADIYVHIYTYPICISKPKKIEEGYRTDRRWEWFFMRVIVLCVGRSSVDCRVNGQISYSFLQLTQKWASKLFWSPYNANPQILRLIPPLLIGTFLRCASPQIENPQTRKFSWFIRKLQIRKFLLNIAQLCPKTVLKVVFLNDFCSVQSIRALSAIFVRLKSKYLRTCRSFKSAKKLSPQITNPQITNPQITKQIGSAKSQIC